MPRIFCGCSTVVLPSGELTWQWKITIFNGQIHYKWPFSIAMLVYQRVTGKIIVLMRIRWEDDDPLWESWCSFSDILVVPKMVSPRIDAALYGTYREIWKYDDFSVVFGKYQPLKTWRGVPFFGNSQEDLVKSKVKFSPTPGVFQGQQVVSSLWITPSDHRSPPWILP